MISEGSCDTEDWSIYYYSIIYIIIKMFYYLHSKYTVLLFLT